MKENRWYYNKWFLIAMSATIVFSPLAIALYNQKSGRPDDFFKYFESLSEDRYISLLWLIVFLPYGLYRVYKCKEVNKYERIGAFLLLPLILITTYVYYPDSTFFENSSKATVEELKATNYVIGDDFDSGNYKVKQVEGNGSIKVQSKGYADKTYNFNQQKELEIVLRVGDTVSVSNKMSVLGEKEGQKND